MGTVAGGIALARFGAGTAFSLQAEPGAGRAAAQGAWIEDGLIDAGGSHEPYSFVVRRGGHSVNAREIYEHAQSEEVIRTLRDQGVEVFHTHLYKGFGMAAERAEMEDTVRTAAIAHRLGMTRGAISKLADRLVAKALMTRLPGKNDRRYQALALTAEGRGLVPELTALADRNDAKFFGHLSETDRAALERIMQDIVRKRGRRTTPID